MGSTSEGADPSSIRRIVALPLAVVLGLGISCTSDGPPSGRAEPSASDAPADGAPSAGSGGDGGSDETSEPTAAAPIAGETRVDDRSNRLTSSGRSPSYLEIAGARVEGDPSGLELELDLSGNPPGVASARDGRTRLGFSIMAGDRRFTFEAEPGPDGWHGIATSPEGTAPGFPGELNVNGSTISMKIDWAYLRGVTRFTWLATAAWAERGGTAYAFDSAPEDGPATFP